MKKEDFYKTKIKLKNKKESIKIQNIMFKLGFEWNSCYNGPEFTDKQFLYFEKEGYILYGDGPVILGHIITGK